MIPDRRFRPEPMTAIEAIEWLKTHDYIWYHAPMDHKPYRLSIKSKLKLWKRNPERFTMSLETLQFETLRINNSHLGRLVKPFELWHHGVSATVYHIRYVGQARSIELHQTLPYVLAVLSPSSLLSLLSRSWSLQTPW